MRKRDELGQSRRAGAPMLAIVSLSDQRVTIYDAEGKILQSPVSTGSTGYETPAGIYSVVQKKEVHHPTSMKTATCPSCSASPGPASPCMQACCRANRPRTAACACRIAFAQRLFDLTDIGLRVIVVRDDILPSDIAHPALFKPDPARREAALAVPPARPFVRQRPSAAS